MNWIVHIMDHPGKTVRYTPSVLRACDLRTLGQDAISERSTITDENFDTKQHEEDLRLEEVGKPIFIRIMLSQSS